MLIRNFGTLALLFALTLCGCGPTVKPTGTVSGTVMMDGKPITTGDVNFFDPATGVAAKAPLDAAGKFTLPAAVDVGSYKIYITPSSLMSTGGADGSAPPAVTAVPVPPKYTVMDTTTLKHDVKAGSNEVPVVLTP